MTSFLGALSTPRKSFGAWSHLGEESLPTLTCVIPDRLRAYRIPQAQQQPRRSFPLPAVTPRGRGGLLNRAYLGIRRFLL